MTSSHAISCEQIQSELTRIWESLEGTNKMRASLFNLVCYTQKNTRLDYIRKIANKVIEKFPSRIILVSVDNEQVPGFLQASVSVISASKGECDVACDFIEIDVAGTNKDLIPFVILPHILPDLPITLLWAENPAAREPIAFELEKLATRIIFDSESTNNLPQFAQAVLEQKLRAKCDVADLNWARLESWRDLLSQTFDSEDRLAELEHAQSMNIQYNAQGTAAFCHLKIQAIYLQAWLACQLEWKLWDISIDEENITFVYHKAIGTVSITLEPVKHAGIAPGGVVSLELTTDQNAHFMIGRNLEYPNQINMQISTPHACELPSRMIFGKADAGQSLVKEICHKGTSSHYLKVLNLIATMDILEQC